MVLLPYSIYELVQLYEASFFFCFITGSSEIEGRPDTGAESGSWLFLQLLGGEMNEDLDSSEEEVEEGEKQEEEEAGEKEEEEKKEEKLDTGKGENGGGEDEVILSVNHDTVASHESLEENTKTLCQNAVRKKGSSKILSNARIKQSSNVADTCNDTSQQSPPECNTSTQPANCNPKKPKDTSQISTADVQAESCRTKSNFADSKKAPPTTEVASNSDSSVGSTTKGRRLLDLLTSTVEDRSPRTPVLETHEELTSCEASTERNQSAVMEVCVCFISLHECAYRGVGEKEKILNLGSSPYHRKH